MSLWLFLFKYIPRDICYTTSSPFLLSPHSNSLYLSIYLTSRSPSMMQGFTSKDLNWISHHKWMKKSSCLPSQWSKGCDVRLNNLLPVPGFHPICQVAQRIFHSKQILTELSLPAIYSWFVPFLEPVSRGKKCYFFFVLLH